MSTVSAVRQATGTQRPGHDHGCKPVEVVPGVWTAHFHDIETTETLKTACPNVKTVVNSATDKCPTKPGSYGARIDVVVVDGLLDDPEPWKKVDAMLDGPEKEAAKKALPQFDSCECAGDAKKDFDRVNKAIDAAKAAGGDTMVHCYASLSRSAAFVLAYMMKDQRITLVEAINQMRKKWDATWPNDTFVEQLLEYEQELGLTPGVMHMKVTAKKSIGFYVKSAKSFFSGIEDKDGNKKEPVCVLHISGLGASINAAIAAAVAVEKEGLGNIKQVRTDYPNMDRDSHGCARVKISIFKV